MPFDFSSEIKRIPREPGVYLMKAGDGEIIYVGKAANLNSRVRQYFVSSGDNRYFVGLLEQWLDSIEVILTSNEKEALILENELIKRHQPRFNVELKDDKNFLHLRIDESAKWPRIEVVRRPRRDGARYFGPYHSASKIRETVNIVERHFQLRTCDDLSFKNRSRPCLQYQIKRCPAPCVLAVDEDEYRRQTREVSLFLQGRLDDVVTRIDARMKEAAQRLAYEEAARYRDQLLAIKGSLESQHMVDLKERDRDIVGLYREGGLLQIVVLSIRKGRMVGSKGFDFHQQGVPDGELLSTFCNLYYSGGRHIPHDVLTPIVPDGVHALAERLTDLKGRKVVIRTPRRGADRKLLELAARNAKHGFFQARREEAVRDGGLVRLKKRLSLANMPYRIECFDISLFQGDQAVGSQVVFEGGVPNRSHYRRYNIKTVEGTDDYAMMREVLLRRLERGLAEEDLPDMIVIDGGKGQLNVVLAVMSDLGIEGVDVVGLAKSRVLEGAEGAGGSPLRSSERVFIPGVKDPIYLKPHTDELFLMTHLRDEAHRFAIEFHRLKRRKKTIKSRLDRIPGVGQSRRRNLLRAFGSVKGVAQADVAEIGRVSGIGAQLAETIHRTLNGDN